MCDLKRGMSFLTYKKRLSVLVNVIIPYQYLQGNVAVEYIIEINFAIIINILIQTIRKLAIIYFNSRQLSTRGGHDAKKNGCKRGKKILVQLKKYFHFIELLYH